jgi:hypothetical protein
MRKQDWETKVGSGGATELENDTHAGGRYQAIKLRDLLEPGKLRDFLDHAIALDVKNVRERAARGSRRNDDEGGN